MDFERDCEIRKNRTRAATGYCRYCSRSKNRQVEGYSTAMQWRRAAACAAGERQKRCPAQDRGLYHGRSSFPFGVLPKIYSPPWGEFCAPTIVWWTTLPLVRREADESDVLTNGIALCTVQIGRRLSVFVITRVDVNQ